MLSYLLLATISATAAMPAADAGRWLTIMGDIGNASQNTIQVNPQPLESRGQFKTMQVRVSRSANRMSWDGVPYRSYESRVMFDCTRRAARYEHIDYYTAPYWRGAIDRSVSYMKGEPRWMLFRDVEPNPTQRIISAACAPSPSLPRVAP